jgi:extracellular elastinolytic metalloproteinase
VLTFNPANATGDDQKVLNIFYYCCYMHDFSYLLGFREASRNFQTNNLGRGGLAGDPVDARSFPGAVFGTANMSRSVDGTSPIMNMGMVTSTNRHTAFDSTVVFHSSRTASQPPGRRRHEHEQPLLAIGGGMGRLERLHRLHDQQRDRGGNWILNNANGIRNFPYWHYRTTSGMSARSSAASTIPRCTTWARSGARRCWR